MAYRTGSVRDIIRDEGRVRVAIKAKGGYFLRLHTPFSIAGSPVSDYRLRKRHHLCMMPPQLL